MVIILDIKGTSIELSSRKRKSSNAKLSFFDCHRQKKIHLYTGASIYFIAKCCEEIEWEITKKFELPSWALFIESISKL